MNSLLSVEIAEPTKFSRGNTRYFIRWYKTQNSMYSYRISVEEYGSSYTKESPWSYLTLEQAQKAAIGEIC